jgi:hypothetical protein
VVFLAVSQPQDWTTNSTILAWISVASLIIGVLSIIIGIIVGYWFYRKGKSLKQIVYEFIADTPIMSIREQTGRGKIKVIYEDSGGHTKDLNNGRLFTLRVHNTGNTDVKIWNATDTDLENMEEPIEFEFEGRTVVGLTEVETNPLHEVIQQKNLNTYLDTPSPVPACLGLPRCLLKPTQWLQLSVLLQGSGGKIRVKGKLFNGEILNIRDLEKRKKSVQRIVTIMLVSGGLAALIGILLLFPSSLSITLAVAAVTASVGSLSSLASGIGEALYERIKKQTRASRK